MGTRVIAAPAATGDTLSSTVYAEVVATSKFDGIFRFVVRVRVVEGVVGSLADRAGEVD